MNRSYSRYWTEVSDFSGFRFDCAKLRRGFNVQLFQILQGMVEIFFNVENLRFWILKKDDIIMRLNWHSIALSLKRFFQRLTFLKVYFRFLMFITYLNSLTLVDLKKLMCRKFWTFMWTKIIKKSIFLKGFFCQAVKN